MNDHTCTDVLEYINRTQLSLTLRGLTSGARVRWFGAHIASMYLPMELTPFAWVAHSLQTLLDWMVKKIGAIRLYNY